MCPMKRMTKLIQIRVLDATHQNTVANNIYSVEHVNEPSNDCATKGNIHEMQ